MSTPTAIRTPAPRSAPAAMAGTGVAVTRPTTGETVLVVEDNHQVREIVRITLRARGYTVLEASCGREAVNLCESHRGPIHVLVTDMVMPQMSGRETADRVCRLRPAARVLYVSGHLEEAIDRHGGLEEGADFLEKPFPMGKLADKVREILDRY